LGQSRRSVRVPGVKLVLEHGLVVPLEPGLRHVRGAVGLAAGKDGLRLRIGGENGKTRASLVLTKDRPGLCLRGESDVARTGWSLVPDSVLVGVV
jgi:hypothetical protein